MVLKMFSSKTKNNNIKELQTMEISLISGGNGCCILHSGHYPYPILEGTVKNNIDECNNECKTNTRCINSGFYPDIKCADVTEEYMQMKRREAIAEAIKKYRS